MSVLNFWFKQKQSLRIFGFKYVIHNVASFTLKKVFRGLLVTGKEYRELVTKNEFLKLDLSRTNNKLGHTLNIINKLQAADIDINNTKGVIAVLQTIDDRDEGAGTYWDDNYVLAPCSEDLLNMSDEEFIESSKQWRN